MHKIYVVVFVAEVLIKMRRYSQEQEAWCSEDHHYAREGKNGKVKVN
jgi:hypothetical protein